MIKSELRNLYLTKRKVLSSEKIDEISLEIIENLKSMSIWENSTFHVFIPIINQNEINTYPLIQYLFQLKKYVIVPKIENDKMISCLIDSQTEFESGKFNVPEPKTFQIIDPKEIDVIFMPMIICDLKGNRVGYGGGFYDQFLKECKGNTMKIGLNLFNPIDQISDVFESDVPLDYCVTGNAIVSF